MEYNAEGGIDCPATREKIALLSGRVTDAPSATTEVDVGAAVSHHAVASIGTVGRSAMFGSPGMGMMSAMPIVGAVGNIAMVGYQMATLQDRVDEQQAAAQVQMNAQTDQTALSMLRQQYAYACATPTK
ncbi:MAG: hypothetical protein IPM60_16050 [Rhodospirillales bacterium]|nr:hypothetical protein [Rhodospirillales bacterium]